MTERDLFEWFLLTIVGVVMPFAVGIGLILRSLTDEALIECSQLSSPPLIPWFLIKTLVGAGGDHLECLEGTEQSFWAPTIMFVFLILTVVLLLNLLIAKFAKTFDVIFDTLDLNYQLLFARIVLSAKALPLFPAPFNLLALPYRAVAGVR